MDFETVKMIMKLQGVEDDNNVLQYCDGRCKKCGGKAEHYNFEIVNINAGHGIRVEVVSLGRCIKCGNEVPGFSPHDDRYHALITLHKE